MGKGFTLEHSVWFKPRILDLEPTSSESAAALEYS